MAFPIGTHNNKKERIGRMRHQIRFISQSTTIDAVGGEVHVWVTGDNVWSNVEYLRPDSDDGTVSNRYTNITQALAVIRYDSGIETQMRLLHDATEWEIQSILPFSHNRYMQLELTRYHADSDSNEDGNFLEDDDGNFLIDDDGNLLG